jgi:hypothetical protein
MVILTGILAKWIQDSTPEYNHVVLWAQCYRDYVSANEEIKWQ